MWAKVEKMNFRGITSITVDAKGRINMPARYRDELAQLSQGRIVVTIDAEDPCLLIYPFNYWDEIEQQLIKLSGFNPTTKRIKRLLIGHATEMVLDHNARLLLPPLLREYAHLTREAMLVGQGKKFELWDKVVWEAARSEWIKPAGDLTRELPDELAGLSL